VLIVVIGNVLHATPLLVLTTLLMSENNDY